MKDYFSVRNVGREVIANLPVVMLVSGLRRRATCSKLNGVA
jgi:hypothetical protein